MYLAIRTDNSQAEIYLLDGGRVVKEKIWQANRSLARDLPGIITEFIENNYDILSGIAIYSGPGSFTGLRIGISVANVIADYLKIPIAGQGGANWITECVTKLDSGMSDVVVLPNYGAAPHITPPKK